MKETDPTFKFVHAVLQGLNFIPKGESKNDSFPVPPIPTYIDKKDFFSLSDNKGGNLSTAERLQRWFWSDWVEEPAMKQYMDLQILMKILLERRQRNA